jgi:hypothetical protein
MGRRDRARPHHLSSLTGFCSARPHALLTGSVFSSDRRTLLQGREASLSTLNIMLIANLIFLIFYLHLRTIRIINTGSIEGRPADSRLIYSPTCALCSTPDVRLRRRAVSICI